MAATGPQPPRRTLGAGASLGAVSQLIAAVMGGLMGILLARILGAAGTGELNVILTAALVLTAVCSLGIEVGLNYHVSGGRWPAAAAVRQSQFAAVVLGLAAVALGVGLGYLLSDSAFEGVSIGALGLGLASIPFAFSWRYSSYVALSCERYEAYATAPGAQNSVALLVATPLALAFGVTGAVVGITVSHALVAAGMLVWALRAFARPAAGWWRDSVRRLREATSFGIRANLSNVLQMFNYRADLFFLNAVVSSAEVGRYAIATSIAAIGQLLPRALANVVLPRVASLDAARDDAALRMVAVKSVRHGVIISIAMGVLLGAGLLLVPAVYGAEFRGATKLGWLLIPGTVFIAVGGVFNSTVVGRGKPEYALYNVLCVTPPTLALYVLLIPSLGAVGAGIASSLSYMGTTVIAWFYFRRMTGLGLWVLRPGRDELADYRRLAQRLRTRLRAKSSSASE